MRAVWASDAGWRRTMSVTPIPRPDLARGGGRRGRDHGHGVEPDVRAALAGGGLGHEVGRPDREREPVQQVVDPPDRVEALLLAPLGRRRAPRRPAGAPRPSPTARDPAAAMAGNLLRAGGASNGGGWRPSAAGADGRRPGSGDAAWAATGATTSQPSRGAAGGAGQVHDQGRAAARRPRRATASRAGWHASDRARMVSAMPGTMRSQVGARGLGGAVARAEPGAAGGEDEVRAPRARRRWTAAGSASRWRSSGTTSRRTTSAARRLDGRRQLRPGAVLALARAPSGPRP